MAAEDEKKRPPDPREAWRDTFCPILSHAVLQLPEPEDEQLVLPIGGEKLEAKPAAEAEYVGCQGPACQFFVTGDNRCAMALVPMALGGILNIVLAGAGQDPNAKH